MKEYKLILSFLFLILPCDKLRFSLHWLDLTVCASVGDLWNF